MKDMNHCAGPLERLEQFGISVPEILLPAPGIPLEKFSVIACDQHSAEPEYWAETERIVGDTPSALRLMLPEAWLARSEELEPAIERAMEREPKLRVTMPNLVDDKILENLF